MRNQSILHNPFDHEPPIVYRGHMSVDITTTDGVRITKDSPNNPIAALLRSALADVLIPQQTNGRGETKKMHVPVDDRGRIQLTVEDEDTVSAIGGQCNHTSEWSSREMPVYPEEYMDWCYRCVRKTAIHIAEDDEPVRTLNVSSILIDPVVEETAYTTTNNANYGTNGV